MNEKKLILWRQNNNSLSFLPPGIRVEVVYDADAPCHVCGEPVIEASMGGTNLCPWCDTGTQRPEQAYSGRTIHSAFGANHRCATVYEGCGIDGCPLCANLTIPKFLQSW